jgi:hypothetical protein
MADLKFISKPVSSSLGPLLALRQQQYETVLVVIVALHRENIDYAFFPLQALAGSVVAPQSMYPFPFSIYSSLNERPHLSE